MGFRFSTAYYRFRVMNREKKQNRWKSDREMPSCLQGWLMLNERPIFPQVARVPFMTVGCPVLSKLLVSEICSLLSLTKCGVHFWKSLRKWFSAPIESLLWDIFYFPPKLPRALGMSPRKHKLLNEGRLRLQILASCVITGNERPFVRLGAIFSCSHSSSLIIGGATCEGEMLRTCFS